MPAGEQGYDLGREGGQQMVCYLVRCCLGEGDLVLLETSGNSVKFATQSSYPRSKGAGVFIHQFLSAVGCGEWGGC